MRIHTLINILGSKSVALYGHEARSNFRTIRKVLGCDFTSIVIFFSAQLSIKKRLKLFLTVVTPSFLYGVSSPTLTTSQLKSMDSLQRRMLRSIVGWVRHDSELWSDTIRRMRTEHNQPLKIKQIEDWMFQFARRHFRLICRFVQQGDGWP